MTSILKSNDNEPSISPEVAALVAELENTVTQNPTAIKLEEVKELLRMLPKDGNAELRTRLEAIAQQLQPQSGIRSVIGRALRSMMRILNRKSPEVQKVWTKTITGAKNGETVTIIIARASSNELSFSCSSNTRSLINRTIPFGTHDDLDVYQIRLQELDDIESARLAFDLAFTNDDANMPSVNVDITMQELIQKIGRKK